MKAPEQRTPRPSNILGQRSERRSHNTRNVAAQASDWKAIAVRYDHTAPAILTTATASQLEAFRRWLYGEAAANRITSDELERLDQLANERGAALKAYREAAQRPLPFSGTFGGDAAPTAPSEPLRARRRPCARLSQFSTGRRPTKSPDRVRSAIRRRRVSKGSPIPDTVSHPFTEHGMAVLEIVARAHLARGCCTMTVGEIAARAGVSESTVRRTLAQAEALGLLMITHRARINAPNLPNVVTITSAEWRSWLDKRPKSLRRPRGGGEGVRVRGIRRLKSIPRAKIALDEPSEGREKGRGATR